jgi:hypothetical protein
MIDRLNRCRIKVQFKLNAKLKSGDSYCKIDDSSQVKKVRVFFQEDVTHMELDVIQQFSEVQKNCVRQTLQLSVDRKEQAEKIRLICQNNNAMKEKTMVIQEFGILAKGDWKCPECGYAPNFAPRDECFKKKCFGKRPGQFVVMKWLDAVGTKTSIKIQQQSRIISVFPRHFATSGRSTASGLQWKENGSTKPTQGRELSNSKLANALMSTTTFTQEEWQSFGIHRLRLVDFIRSGDSYFKPAAIVRVEVSISDGQDLKSLRLVGDKSTDHTVEVRKVMPENKMVKREPKVFTRTQFINDPQSIEISDHDGKILRFTVKPLMDSTLSIANTAHGAFSIASTAHDVHRGLFPDFAFRKAQARAEVGLAPSASDAELEQAQAQTDPTGANRALGGAFNSGGMSQFEIEAEGRGGGGG